VDGAIHVDIGSSIDRYRSIDRSLAWADGIGAGLDGRQILVTAHSIPVYLIGAQHRIGSAAAH
jgi:hypothetical protein